MKRNLLQAAILAACLGVAMSAGAQSSGEFGQYQPAVTPPPASDQRLPTTSDPTAPPAYPAQNMTGRATLTTPGTWADQTPPSGVDSTAYTQCHGLNAREYWDCVNSHDGGGGQ